MHHFTTQSSRVEILLASYNGAEYIAEQISSIQRQSYRHWDLLISDDASTDGTIAIIEQFELEDERIKLVSSESHGSAAANFLALIGVATAEFVFLSDQDDIWEENKIEEMLIAFSQIDPSIPVLLAGDAQLVDEDLEILSPSFLSESKISLDHTHFNNLLVQNSALGCTAAFNRSLCNLIQSIPVDSSRVIMHDWWLALLASAFGKFEIVPQKLTKYRQHGKNEVGSFRYSAQNLLRASRTGRKKTELIVHQAQYFSECHLATITSDHKRTLESFIQTFSSPPLTRPWRLARGKFLKSGHIRAFGQMLFAIAYKC